MWKIPSVNHGPSVSILMWQQWSSLTSEDLARCRQRAIDDTFISKLPLLATTWTMKKFSASGTAKYKCESGVDVRIKLHLPTENSRHENDKAMLWNYHCLYFHYRCAASQKNGCRGEVLWFDHAIWYILTHLPTFFEEGESTRGKFMQFLIFLTSVKDAIKDQITFMYTRDLLVVAALELYKSPSARILPIYGDTEGVRVVECLVKPAAFTIEQNKNQVKCKFNLNNFPGPQTKNRGL